MTLHLLLLFLTLTHTITFDITPSHIPKSTTPVTLTWHNIPSPSPTDNITINILHDQLLTQIGTIYLTESPTWSYGYGVIKREWVNMRHDLLIELNTEEETLNALVRFQNWNEPLQGHLALTEVGTEMRVSWVTRDAKVALVEYGMDREMRERVVGVTTSYGIEDFCDGPANVVENFLDPGVIHSAVMTGLQAGQRYFYRFGNLEDGWSDVYEFFAPPDSNSPVEGALYGDMGVGVPFDTFGKTQQMSLKSSAQVQKFIKESKTPFVLHIGDISYARGYAWLWEYWFNMIQPISTRAPYMVGIGNHEYDFIGQEFNPKWANYGKDSGGECGVPYFKRYQMPQNSDSGKSGLWYSFDFGPIHFTVMSTEHDWLKGSPQYEWIKQDLASIDRSKTPWSIFTGHRPLYTSTEGGTSEMTHQLRASIEPLLLQYNVDACFYGHVHHYERFCHLNNGTCVPEGQAPIHVVVGNAGESYQVPYQSMPTKHHYDQPDWVIFRTANFGYGRFFANQTHFTWQMVGAMSNQVHDHFTLRK